MERCSMDSTLLWGWATLRLGARGGRGGGTAGADKSKREIERDLERWVRTRFTRYTFHSHLVAFSRANRALFVPPL